MYQSKQVGRKDAPTPKSDGFDIAGGVAHSSGEILVLSVRDVKMGLGVCKGYCSQAGCGGGMRY